MTSPATPTEAEALLADAARAAVLRAHQTDPAVVALVVERTRIAIERTMWIGITLGMAFTTVTVQQWAATGAERFDLAWWAAWLLAPLVEVPLLAILRGESTAARYGIAPGGWTRRARWTLLVAAYLMNTYAPWAAVLGGHWGWNAVLLHSVPVVAVLVGVEALTDLRVALTAAITAAAAAARPPAPARKAKAPRPEVEREPAPELQRTTSERPTDGRTLRQVGVDWAVENWRDDLRPVEIGEALLTMGLDCSKGERSRMRTDAADIIAARRRRAELAPAADAAELEGVGT